MKINLSGHTKNLCIQLGPLRLRRMKCLAHLKNINKAKS